MHPMTNKIFLFALVLLVSLHGYSNDKPMKKKNGKLDIGITWILVEHGIVQWKDAFGQSKQTGTMFDFNISATEVTFDQYDKFCKATGYKLPKANFGRGKQPVINVNVDDAMAFCEWLSDETGTSIHLPTANEWEYAARGGKKSKGYQYSGSNVVGTVAWYIDNSGNRPHEVATKKPNELGIYDMSGNVMEWCGISGEVIGGGWNFSKVFCNVFGAMTEKVASRSKDYGFRIIQDM
jgi:formylglycine-generating enzyme